MRHPPRHKSLDSIEGNAEAIVSLAMMSVAAVTSITLLRVVANRWSELDNVKLRDIGGELTSLTGFSLHLANAYGITHVPGELARRRMAGLNDIGQIRKSRTWRYRDPRAADEMTADIESLERTFGDITVAE